jgi:hypothetical protein
MMLPSRQARVKRACSAASVSGIALREVIVKRAFRRAALFDNFNYSGRRVALLFQQTAGSQDDLFSCSRYKIFLINCLANRAIILIGQYSVKKYFCHIKSKQEHPGYSH